MALITLLLGILKIILCLLATVLVVAAVLLSVVLFCDIKYFIYGKLAWNESISGKINLDAKITWIFKIFRLKITYGEGENFKAELRALWLKLWPRPPAEPKKRKSVEPEPKPRKPKPQEPKPQEPKKVPTDESKESKESDDPVQGHTPPNKKRKKGISEKIKSFIQRVKNFLGELREKKDKFFYIINYPDREIIIKKVVILLKRLKRITRKGHLRVHGEFGLADPADTGKILGMITAVAGLIGVDCSLKGNFEHETVDINVDLVGKLTLWSLLWPLALFILSKPVWKIVKKTLFGEEDD